MTRHPPLMRRLAFALLDHAGLVLPSSHSSWADAMKHEIHHINGDFEALTWAAGCVVASYVERSRLVNLIQTRGVRLLLALLILGQAAGLLFATALTIAYRLHYLGVARSLGAFTPGDDYRRFIPLMDATPWWLHGLLIAGSMLYLLAGRELLRNRRTAFLLFAAAWIAGAAGELIRHAMPEYRAAFSFPTPRFKRDILIPTTQALVPVLVAAVLWARRRCSCATGATRE